MLQICKLLVPVAPLNSPIYNIALNHTPLPRITLSCLLSIASHEESRQVDKFNHGIPETCSPMQDDLRYYSS